MLPLHHGGPLDENANVAQRFVDSEAGTVVGTLLHTLGALLFTAGVALYVYQSHLFKSSKGAKMSPSLHLLPYAHGFNLAGIAMNGVGGLMRLYQSDHPGMDELGTSAWVQLLFAKHIFLILGVGMAVFLTYRTHMLSLHDDAPSLFLGETRRITGFAWTSFVTIVLASVLGAAATTQLDPMMAAETEGSDDEPGPAAMGHGMVLHFYDNDTGIVTGNALAPGRESSEIQIRQQADQLYMELTWPNAQTATLDLEVRDFNGEAVQGKKTSTAGRVTWEYTGIVLPGTWRADVVSAQAVNERFHLFSRHTIGSLGNGTVLEETYTVNPKTTRGLVELNLLMEKGKKIQYSWDVMGSSEKLDFNVHLHIGQQVEYPVRGSWNRYEGTYQHNSTQEGVSLMWENPTSTPLRLHVRIVGDFGVHSRAIR